MMRRSSKKSTAAASAPSSSGKASSKEVDKLEAFFAKYKDKNEENCIGPEGIEALCSDLVISPSDIKILLLAWKLRAQRMGYFSSEEWMRGMRSMRVDSLDKLKKALPQLQAEISNPEAFRDLYIFAFQFCLTEPRQKTLDVETATTMLQIVMAGQPHLPSFLKFLEEQTEYKAINLDQWTAFHRFCGEVKPDMSNYDENMAWPLLMDNYVEWWRKQHSR